MKITKKKLRKIIREEILNEGNIDLRKGKGDYEIRGNVNDIEGSTIKSMLVCDDYLSIEFDNRKTLRYEVNSSATEPGSDIWTSAFLLIQ